VVFLALEIAVDRFTRVSVRFALRQKRDQAHSISLTQLALSRVDALTLDLLAVRRLDLDALVDQLHSRVLQLREGVETHCDGCSLCGHGSLLFVDQSVGAVGGRTARRLLCHAGIQGLRSY